jgi:SHS2 domain-containing protein
MNAGCSPALGPAPAGFTEIEHVADRAVRVWAGSAAGLFEQAARAMFTLMAGDLSDVAPAHSHVITLDVADLESALVDWLNELLYWRETRREMYSQFRVRLEDGKLYGEFAGSAGAPTAAVIKAATFHDLRIEQDSAGVWHATITFDT